MFPVNIYGMGLQNPVISVEEKYTSLLRASFDIIGAVTVKRGFSTTDHILVVKEEKWDGENIRMTQMMRNSRELVVTKAPLRNAFSSTPITRVPY